MTSARPSARRQRAFLAVMAVAVLGTLAFTFLGSRDRPASDAVAATSTDAAASPEPNLDVPPAYLAWVSGGFASDLRTRVRTLPAFTATVVVAGDTRWMTRSADADGAVVDDPKGSFAIPLDAFAVNPVEYAPFLPEGIRHDVIGALDRGEGVLSSRSATLRGIGIGGTLTFADRDVRIGAIAPDEAIGWSEVLVSREVGERLGIVNDRYLLALTEGKPGLERFTDLIRPLVPGTTAIRVEKPGGSAFMRVASGVNPPIVLKQAFGEFAARPDQRDPAQLTIQPTWVRRHIASRSVPLLGKVTCNVAFFPALGKALHEVEREGLGDLVRTYNGCWNPRTVARSPTAPPSFHAYGAAIDINAATNAYGSKPTMDERIVAIFERYGFRWGGDFLIPDGMHFEYGEPRAAA